MNQTHPHPAPDQDRLLTVNAVGTWLGLSRPTIYELIGSGQLVSYKIGRSRRISGASVATYLERCREEP